MTRRTTLLLTLISAYLYILCILDFPILHHSRRRPFLFDADFVAPFLRYVAGPVDCLASLISQLYYYPWLGALIIFAVLITLYVETTAILRSFGGASRLVSVMPAILGLYLLQQHLTVFSLLSYSFSLCMAVVFIRCKALSPILCTVIFAGLSTITCYVAGGTALLFAVVCVLNELFVQKKYGPAALFLFLGVTVPYALGTVLFEPDRMLQYFIAAPFETASSELRPLNIVWYALCPIAIIATVYTEHLRRYSRALRVSGIVALALSCAFMVQYRFFRYSPMTLDYYAENGEWEKALDYAKRFSTRATIMTAHIVNHALYHAGRLPHDMFIYPQFRNDRLLFLGVGDKEDDVFPRSANRRSDVFYHLGRIDQAERWAHEALTSQGFLVPILRRLVSINVLKDRPKAARVYAGVMNKTVTHRRMAAALIDAFNRNKLLIDDEEINAIRPLLPKTDFVGEWTTSDILTQQLSDAPTNRMAFEYLMAHFLLTGNIEAFGNNVHRAEAFGHSELPRAYEEACLVYTIATGQRPPNLRMNVREETLEKFERFMKIIQKYDKDRRKGWEVLEHEFGDTYWFFKVFGRSASVGPPDFDSKDKVQ